MGAFSKLQAYSFAILLAKPFEKWKAFELGLINDEGEILKKPTTSEEKNSLDSFENLVRKIKRILIKYIPSKKFLPFLVSAYLLKNESNHHGYFNFDEIHCFDELSEKINDKEGELLYNILQTCNKF